jgi:hypothetical protein
MDAFSELQSRRTVENRRNAALPEGPAGALPGLELAFDTGPHDAALNPGSAHRIRSKETDRVAHDIALGSGDRGRVPGAVGVRIQQKLDYPQIEVGGPIKAAHLGFPGWTVKNVVTT